MRSTIKRLILIKGKPHVRNVGKNASISMEGFRNGIHLLLENNKPRLKEASPTASCPLLWAGEGGELENFFRAEKAQQTFV